MATMPPVFQLLILVSSFIIPSSSSTQLLLPLTHTLTHSPTQLPTHLLLKSSSTRSSTCFRSHHHHKHNNKAQQKQQFPLPLSSGSDYTISLSVNPATPPISLFMDTGSDLVWFPCHPFQCILCEGKSRHPVIPPPLPPANSTLVPCFDPSCSAAHSSASTSDLCSIAKCPLEDIEISTCNPKTHHCPMFYYAYGDGSLIAHLRRGPLSLSDSLTFSNFTFACSHSALAEPMGVAGFGRGVLSLPSQLAALSPSLGSRFSYCLISHSFQQDRLIKPSPLILGRTVGPLTTTDTSTFVYTPILHNPKYPYFYLVGLLAIYVGDKRIAADSNMKSVDENGNGGMVVDSGTTFTMLPSGLYSKLVTNFAKKMDGSGFKRAIDVEAETGLKPCYFYNERKDSWRVPELVMEFVGNNTGGKNVSLVEMPRRNYFMGFEREKGKRVGCLMVMDGGDEPEEEGGGGPAGTLGNFQQQGFEMVYDLAEGRVGFARRRCEGLWDDLTRG